MRRIRIVLSLCLFACGRGNAPPKPLEHIALPSGALLDPYDPSQPGEARPLYTAQLGGRVYATLSNPNPTTFAPAGPGFLASIDPVGGKVDVINLGGSDRHQCMNPGVVREDSQKLYVACAGDFTDTLPGGRGLFEVDPARGAVVRAVAMPEGVVPSGVAVAPAKIWVGDGSGGGRILGIERSSFSIADGADDAHPAIAVPCPTTGRPFVPYIGIVGGDLYALCATTEAGMLARFDAQTGAAKGSVAVGAQPTELAGTGDGRIAVVNSNENTLTLVTPGATLTPQLALTFQSPTATLQDVKARGRFLYTVASGSNTVQKIDLAAPGGAKVVAEANTGLNSNPFNLEALDDDTVVVVNYATSDVVAPQLKTVQ
ncbi:MAG: YncE family protein [Myxococcales bacterium]